MLLHVRYNISSAIIATTMVGAIEQACGYWAQAAEPVFKAGDGGWEVDLRALAKGHRWYSEPSVYDTSDWAFRITLFERLGGSKIRIIHKKKLVTGLQRLSAKYPFHFRDFIQEDDDGTTHDVVMQMACFGDIMFG